MRERDPYWDRRDMLELRRAFILGLAVGVSATLAVIVLIGLT